MDVSQSSIWTAPSWRAEVERWIVDELQAHQMELTGAIDQPHVRPWSTVLRVPTSGGDVFFKAAAPALAHEAGVVSLLAKLRPENLPAILALDRHRGWLLMREGGSSLRSVLQADPKLAHWEMLLGEYAALQLQAASHADELLASGLIDRRLRKLPKLFGLLLAHAAAEPPEPPGALSKQELGRLDALTSRLEKDVQALAAVPVPETIDHGDFHDANIFVGGGRYLFFDWGDSSFTYPFFSLRTVFVSVERTFSVPEGSEAHAALTAAYLAPFGHLAPEAQLQEAFGRAQRLAPIIAGLRWKMAMETADPSEKRQYAEAVPGLLREFIDLNENPEM